MKTEELLQKARSLAIKSETHSAPRRLWDDGLEEWERDVPLDTSPDCWDAKSTEAAYETACWTAYHVEVASGHDSGLWLCGSNDPGSVDREFAIHAAHHDPLTMSEWRSVTHKMVDMIEALTQENRDLRKKLED